MEPYEEQKNNQSGIKGEDHSFGPLIAIIIIVALLIIGGLFILRKISPPDMLPRGSAVSGDPVVNSFTKQGTSDLLSDIKKDLSATSIQAVDSGLSPLNGIR